MLSCHMIAGCKEPKVKLPQVARFENPGVPYELQALVLLSDEGCTRHGKARGMAPVPSSTLQREENAHPSQSFLRSYKDVSNSYASQPTGEGSATIPGSRNRGDVCWKVMCLCNPSP